MLSETARDSERSLSRPGRQLAEIVGELQRIHRSDLQFLPAGTALYAWSGPKVARQAHNSGTPDGAAAPKWLKLPANCRGVTAQHVSTDQRPPSETYDQEA